MFDKRALVKKGFVPAGSIRATLVGGGESFKPVPQCAAEDYAQLPPEVKGKYSPTPTMVGNNKVHELRT